MRLTANPTPLPMPADYELDLDRQLVRSRYWGLVTESDIREVYDRLRTDPGFRSSFRQLCDLREVTEITASTHLLQEMARMTVFAPGVRRAFVVARDIEYGLARMYQVHSESVGSMVAVFRNWEAAEAWVG